MFHTTGGEEGVVHLVNRSLGTSSIMTRENQIDYIRPGYDALFERHWLAAVQIIKEKNIVQKSMYLPKYYDV